MKISNGQRSEVVADWLRVFYFCSFGQFVSNPIGMALEPRGGDAGRQPRKDTAVAPIGLIRFPAVPKWMAAIASRHNRIDPELGGIVIPVKRHLGRLFSYGTWLAAAG
jgi:hypothetical protein